MACSILIICDIFFNGSVGTVALGAADRFIYNSSTGGLLFDADGTGSLAALQIASLTNLPSLTNADIRVIA
jgi:Ca2+-binding RTX toxin-like protein